jgi:colicin import membrane protein
MSGFVYTTGQERTISGALALVMHALFFLMLVLGVSWQKRQGETRVVDLWSNLPSAPESRVEPPPPPKVKPAPPRPLPKAEPRPEPKAEPKPPPKAEIDLREKQEKERKAKEQAALERKKREEKALAEKKRREEQAHLEAERKKQAAEAEAKRLARERDDALRKIAQQEQVARAGEVDRYKRAIAARIKSKIYDVQNLKGNPEVEYTIVVLPGGEVFDVRLRRASGQPAWDSAVERAIRAASPLPLPSPASPIFSEFRELNLKFRPKE